MKPIWIVLLCLLGAAALAALVWLLVWYVEQRVLAKALGRVPERADAQAAWEQHVLRKQGWTADSEQGRAALARVRAGVAAMQEQPHEDVFTPATDGTRLHARLYRVPHAHATVILCHGYHSHAEHDFSAQFPALYASGGCNLLLIDERAHGLSEGKCLTFGQLERYDIAQWVHWVREHSRVQRPIALYGVSMGAASVLLAAQLPELKGELACVVPTAATPALSSRSRTPCVTARGHPAGCKSRSRASACASCAAMGWILMPSTPRPAWRRLTCPSCFSTATRTPSSPCTTASATALPAGVSSGSSSSPVRSTPCPRRSTPSATGTSCWSSCGAIRTTSGPSATSRSDERAGRSSAKSVRF